MLRAKNVKRVEDWLAHPALHANPGRVDLANRIKSGADHIIAGIALAERIVHHFKHNIWLRNAMRFPLPGPRHAGAGALSTAEFIKALHQRFAVRAKVQYRWAVSPRMPAARNWIDWVSHFDHISELYLVHGELEKMQALQKTLKEQLNWDASIPEPGEQIAI